MHLYIFIEIEHFEQLLWLDLYGNKTSKETMKNW